MDGSLVIFAFAALAGLALAEGAALHAWQAWLALQRAALESARPLPSPAAARIELASLRERVRRLEAIATGIEL
ncbi:MAG: hypothetical protein QOH04_430 [Sphingomonadales bacterium]|nr:hypothetical protein [Sphingomonadales bacterium]MEA3034671.1 hypothetical protein [Sphingomonadales bacterium]